MNKKYFKMEKKLNIKKSIIKNYKIIQKLNFVKELGKILNY